MKKRIVSIFLTLVMLYSCMLGFSLAAQAKEAAKEAVDVTKYLAFDIKDGEAWITRYATDQYSEIVLPDTIDGYPVTRICNGAFFWKENLKEVTVGKYVKVIEKGAFDCCYALENIYISASVESIENSAFVQSFHIQGIWVDESNPYYSSDATGVLFNQDKTKIILIPTGHYGAYTVPETVKSVGSYLYFGGWIYDLTFLADAPVFEENCFFGRPVNVYYPANNPTWTEEVMQNYGSEVTWIPYSPEIPGDLDGDEVVDNKDVEYLLWYTLFPEDYPISANADYTGDEMIDNQDVEQLLWHTLFPEDYPLS